MDLVVPSNELGPGSPAMGIITRGLHTRRSQATNRQLRRGAHRSTLELERALPDDIDVKNRTPKPFIWTKTADEILTSIERFCQRISGTGH
jgi:hypothetical protein